jgi:hypothetical protein
MLNHPWEKRGELQLQHDTGPSGGGPCSRCGIRYSRATAYLPCFEKGDNLKAWVARHAETIIACKGHVPELLVEMATEVQEKR